MKNDFLWFLLLLVIMAGLLVFTGLLSAKLKSDERLAMAKLELAKWTAIHAQVKGCR